MKNTRIAAIDVGTTKTCTIIGILDGLSGLRVLGMGIAPSQGMDNGLVANISEVAESIRQSVKNAEIMAGYRLESASISLNGRHISSMNNRGTVAITHKDQMVHPHDLHRALDIALDVKVQEDRQLLSVIPRSYTLDGNRVENPVGMHGYELNVEVHLITAAITPIQNLTQCLTDAGIKINDLIPVHLASAIAVLREEEKQNGILIADIGGGTTNVAVVKDGSIYHTSVLPLAGSRITGDIAAVLGLSSDLAEEIKKKYGSVVPPEEINDRNITIDKKGCSVSQRDLCNIIRARTEELIQLILLELLVFELPRVEYARLIPSGVIITGGCANLPGIVELVKGVTQLPVRVGTPPILSGVSGTILSDPAYAASIGLLLCQVMPGNRLKWVSKREYPRFYPSIFRSLSD